MALPKSESSKTLMRLNLEKRMRAFRQMVYGLMLIPKPTRQERQLISLGKMRLAKLRERLEALENMPEDEEVLVAVEIDRRIRRKITRNSSRRPYPTPPSKSDLLQPAMHLEPRID